MHESIRFSGKIYCRSKIKGLSLSSQCVIAIHPTVEKIQPCLHQATGRSRPRDSVPLVQSSSVPLLTWLAYSVFLTALAGTVPNPALCPALLCAQPTLCLESAWLLGHKWLLVLHDCYGEKKCVNWASVLPSKRQSFL